MKVDNGHWIIQFVFYHLRGKKPVMEMDLNVGVLFC